MCPSKHDAKSSNLAIRATACKNAASSYVHALNLPIRVPEDPNNDECGTTNDELEEEAFYSSFIITSSSQCFPQEWGMQPPLSGHIFIPAP